MTPEKLWEKYRGNLMLEHEFLAALKEYGEAVRAEAEELRKDAERQWVGLTGDEIEDLPKGGTWWEIIRAAEEILKEKNSGHI